MKHYRPFAVDLGLNVGSTANMIWLRTIFMVVMIVAILPWGAFTAQFASPIKPTAEVSGVSVSVDVAEPEVKAVRAAKRCKGPALPGSPCGPQVLAIVPAAGADVEPRVSVAWFTPADVRLGGTFDETALDPPIPG